MLSRDLGTCEVYVDYLTVTSSEFSCLFDYHSVTAKKRRYLPNKLRTHIDGKYFNARLTLVFSLCSAYDAWQRHEDGSVFLKYRFYRFLLH